MTADRRGEPAVLVDGLWKSYRPRMHQLSLRQEAAKLIKQSFRRPDMPGEDLFWALRDVGFSIGRGESVALVGRNGSGKTTLLRVLCGITRPARGRAQVNGRFATLIALGAGFNFELTGRANIYLNAAIQGVPPRRIAPRVDDIIEFSELADFIDVPVKRYSSGMVTRLGFSIATHILPEIIFVDEVLAVGDQGFQRKCIERMALMKEQGQTLLFVSHAPDIIRELCERAIWLHEGRLVADGTVDDVLAEYGHMLGVDEAEHGHASSVDRAAPRHTPRLVRGDYDRGPPEEIPGAP